MKPSGKVSERPWGHISEASYQDAGAYCDACLINENTGPRAEWVKAKCKLPVYEPNGDLNRNAGGAIAATLSGGRGGVMAPAEMKRMAARHLITLYRQIQRDPPAFVRRMAGT